MISQRSQAIANPVDEATIGQGDCAFNAFALGFCTPRVLEHLEAIYQANPNAGSLWVQFIDRIAPLLGVPANWPSIKEKLTVLRRNGSLVKLQQTLAPLFRELAVSLMRNDPESMERTIEPLTTAFRQHASRGLGFLEPALQDDLFRQHPFIRRRFDLFTQVARFLLQIEPVGFDFKNYTRLLLLGDARTPLQQQQFAEMARRLDPRIAIRHEKYMPVFAIYFEQYPNQFDVARYKALQAKQNRSIAEVTELKQLEEQLDLLFVATDKLISRWWRKKTPGSGYQRFLNQMQRRGEWAGDLELAVLARYFNLNLDVYLDHSMIRQRIHYDCGTIGYTQFGSELKRDEIEQLILRGLVDRTPYLNRVLASPREFENAKQQIVLALLPTDNKISLHKRLDQIADFAKVSAFIRANDTSLKGKLIPVAEEWSSDCIDEMLQRDVIVKSGSTGHYHFNLDASAALARIAALPQHAEIAAQLEQAHAEHAVIALRHAGNHWNNLLTHDESKAFADATQSVFTGTNLYKDTLFALQQNKIQYNEKRWQEIIARATRDIDTENKIRYAVDGKEDSDIELSEDTDEELRRSVEKARADRFVVYVDAQDAVALDEELAKKMQLEFYDACLQYCQKP